ncbi:MAG: hypothetical protein IMW89_13425 [Ktedonobacteraceae bacterium]|nr:hypothetical protein [Ktedonobacteraceae bacterium]
MSHRQTRVGSLSKPLPITARGTSLNYAVSYKGIVQLLAFWLLVPAVVSLLLAIPVAFISRGPTFRAAAKLASDGA